jgi:hypothetical protein
MEDERAGKQRRWQRCFESSRVEEEVWLRAFELIWPLVRRAPQPRASPAPGTEPKRLATAKGA